MIEQNYFFPREILCYLFAFVEGKDLAHLTRVCQIWKEVAESNHLWCSLYKQDWPFHDTSASSNRSWKQLYQERQYKEYQWTLTPQLVPIKLSKHEIYANVADKVGLVTKVVFPQSVKYTETFYKQRNWLIRTTENDLEIWDQNRNQLRYILPETAIWHRSVKFDQDKIAYIDEQDSIRVYNLQTGDLINRISGSSTESVQIFDQYTIVHDSDHPAYLYMWNNDTRKLEGSFVSESDIKSFILNRDKQELIAGCEDGIIRKWPLISEGHMMREELPIREDKAKRCFQMLEGHESGVNFLISDHNQIISSTHTTIKIWDDQNGNCLHTLNIDPERNCCLDFIRIKQNKIIATTTSMSSNADLSLIYIYIWDRKTGNLLHKFKPNMSILSLNILEDQDEVVITQLATWKRFALSFTPNQANSSPRTLLSAINALKTSLLGGRG